MIATSGYFDGYDRSTSAIVIYASSTQNYPITSSCDFYFRIPVNDPPDPKKRIPFYRALFDQRFPQPPTPRIRDVKKARWKPNMGTVRINRSNLRKGI